MEIVTQLHGPDSAELKVRGRLDGYWSEHLSGELDKLVRQGTHRLWLDVAEVTYLSSLGIGVMVRFYKQLKALGGSLKVVNPSEPVKEVLAVLGLACWSAKRRAGQHADRPPGIARVSFGASTTRPGVDRYLGVPDARPLQN